MADALSVLIACKKQLEIIEVSKSKFSEYQKEINELKDLEYDTDDEMAYLPALLGFFVIIIMIANGIHWIIAVLCGGARSGARGGESPAASAATSASAAATAGTTATTEQTTTAKAPETTADDGYKSFNDVYYGHGGQSREMVEFAVNDLLSAWKAKNTERMTFYTQSPEISEQLVKYAEVIDFEAPAAIDDYKACASIEFGEVNGEYVHKITKGKNKWYIGIVYDDFMGTAPLNYFSAEQEEGYTWDTEKGLAEAFELYMNGFNTVTDLKPLVENADPHYLYHVIAAADTSDSEGVYTVKRIEELAGKVFGIDKPNVDFANSMLYQNGVITDVPHGGSWLNSSTVKREESGGRIVLTVAYYADNAYMIPGVVMKYEMELDGNVYRILKAEKTVDSGLMCSGGSI